MKKIIAMVLAVLMLASLTVTALAEGELGSITINGVTDTAIYEIYRLLDLESYDIEAGAYSYKANAAWTAFFATDEAKAYMATDADGYVTWIATEDDDTKATFAKLALAYAQANDIAPVKSSENEGEFVITEKTGVFSELDLGYYLIDSTVGALCGLTTTNPHASINAKNAMPTIDKQVQEDSTNQWGSNNTADIGQTIEYRVTINVHAGAQNYVLHDAMSAGLTFSGVSKIEHVVPSSNTHEVSTDLYEVTTENSCDDENCTFEVRFSNAFCDELETNDKVIIYYSAVLNSDAIVAGEGNDNNAWLEFGDKITTTRDVVTTYTFAFDLVKTDSSNKLISGAEFKIYDAPVGGNEIKVVPMEDGTGYRRAKENEEGVSIVVTDGKVRVSGLDNGTYYLEETVAPDGYNKLSARQKFIISDSNLDAVFNNNIYSTGSGVHVVNKTGSMLPETGGLGTLLFTLFGSTTVLGTGVVLVTKKRASKFEDEE